MSASVSGKGTMQRIMRSWALQLLESPWFVRALAATRGHACAAILMHRFASAENQSGRHSAEALRLLLASLQGAGISFVDLETAISYCKDLTVDRPRLSVSFTVDDGYTDFAEIAWPIFREFDCPVSLFVVPGVIDRQDWFWWDKLEWITRSRSSANIRLLLNDRESVFAWADEGSRQVAYADLASAIKQIPSDSVSSVLAQLCQITGSTLPAIPPAEYRILDWSALRSLEAQGVRIGPHTMTHPVLSQCTDESSSYEIANSISRLRDELADPLPVFCYPNGRSEDHGIREWANVRDAGLHFALTTSTGILESGVANRLGDSWQLRLPRLGFDTRAGRIIREFVP